jgi:hypothetical protein
MERAISRGMRQVREGRASNLVVDAVERYKAAIAERLAVRRKLEESRPIARELVKECKAAALRLTDGAPQMVRELLHIDIRLCNSSRTYELARYAVPCARFAIATAM